MSEDIEFMKSRGNTLRLINLPVLETEADKRKWQVLLDSYNRLTGIVVGTFQQKYGVCFAPSKEQFEGLFNFLMKFGNYRPEITGEEYDKIVRMHMGLLERDEKLLEKIDLEFERLNTLWLQEQLV